MWDKLRKDPLQHNSNVSRIRRKRKKLSLEAKALICSQILSRESFSEYASKYDKEMHN